MFTAKEYAIGMVLGFVVGWVAWAVQSAGSLIDNQRGASMASMMDPLHGEETSSLGILLSQAFLTYILATGTFLALFGDALPKLRHLAGDPSPATAGRSVPDPHPQPGRLRLPLRIVLAGPLVAVMFLSEFALAIVSRFSPQVQVFVLAMPIKSALAIFMLIFYFGRRLLRPPIMSLPRRDCHRAALRDDPAPKALLRCPAGGPRRRERRENRAPDPEEGA